MRSHGCDRSEARRCAHWCCESPSRRHEDVDVDVVRYLGPEQTLPALTRLSVRRAARMSIRRLGIGRDHVISHTIWPVALVAEHLAREAGIPWTVVFTDGMLMWGCITP